MKPLKAFFSLMFLLFILPFGNAYAECAGTFINPVSDICWKCIFPIKIAGVAGISYSDVPPDKENISTPICVCGTNIGVTYSYWNPSRVVETVKDPYCFPLMGMEMSNTSGGRLAGSNKRVAHTTFAQAHYYIFPVWNILDLFIDMSCTDSDEEFDLAYMTEVDPLWNNDFLSLAANPETVLFANPAAQLSCMTDSVAATTTGVPINKLYWCMGAWGSTYPMAGTISSDNYIEANAGLAARMLYKLSRQLLSCDPARDICGCSKTPLWKKTNYRLQLVDPVKDNTCHPIGRSSMLWERNKNPVYEGDNFTWMIFKKTLCCMYLYSL